MALTISMAAAMLILVAVGVAYAIRDSITERQNAKIRAKQAFEDRYNALRARACAANKGPIHYLDKMLWYEHDETGIIGHVTKIDGRSYLAKDAQFSKMYADAIDAMQTYYKMPPTRSEVNVIEHNRARPPLPTISQVNPKYTEMTFTTNELREIYGLARLPFTANELRPMCGIKTEPSPLATGRTNCPNCGAPLDGGMCKYCKTQVGR